MKFSLEVVIDKVTVIRSNSRDEVQFDLAEEDTHGRRLAYAKLHAGRDDYNGRSLKFETVKGNGPDLARLLGWPGEIDVIDVSGKIHKRRLIEAWNFRNDRYEETEIK